MNSLSHKCYFFLRALGSFCWQGVSASSDLVKTWHPQAVGANKCLSLPFRLGASAGPTGSHLWFVPHCSHIPGGGGMPSKYLLTKVSKRKSFLRFLRVCLLVIKRPPWVRESMNFRAGRDLNGDLVQPLHFINKETDPERRALPKVKHLVLGESWKRNSEPRLLLLSTAALCLIWPDPCLLKIYNWINTTFLKLKIFA